LGVKHRISFRTVAKLNAVKQHEQSQFQVARQLAWPHTPRSVHAPRYCWKRSDRPCCSNLADASTDQHLKLERVILFAKDIDALWHARPALRSAVAGRLGAADVSRRMADITQLFEGYVPGLLLPTLI
jgi:hypothetical protein